MRYRSWSAALILITGLGGCSERSSAPHTSRDLATSAATTNNTADLGESENEPVSGSATGHSLPSNAGTVTRAKAPKRRPLAKFQPVLVRVDKDPSTVAEALTVLRPLGPEALTVVLATPRPESDVLPVGRRALLLELCAHSSAQEAQAGYPDPSLLLNESRSSLADSRDAGVTLLLFFDSFPYQGEQRYPYWAALQSVMETSPYAYPRLLAYGQLSVACKKLTAEYMTEFKQAQEGIGVEAQAVTIRDLEALGQQALMFAMSDLQNWKMALQNDLEFWQKGEEALERRKQSPYYTAIEADRDIVRRLREAGTPPKDMILQPRIENIIDEMKYLRSARIALVDKQAQRLELPPCERPREATSDAWQRAELGIRIGRCWLSRGKPEAACNAFLDASSLGAGEGLNSRLFGAGMCGTVLASRAIGNFNDMRSVFADSAALLTNAEVTDEQNRFPALAALYQLVGEVVQDSDPKNATILYEECEQLLDGVRESQPTAEIETYLLVAELWFDAGEYVTAQASLDKISGRLNELADRTPRRVAEVLLRSGEARLSQEQANEAIPILERVLDLCRAKKLDQLVTEASGLLALAQVEAGNIKVAEDLVASVTKTSGAQAPSLTTLAILDLTVGQVLLQQNSQDEALEFLQSAKVIIEQERGSDNYLARKSQALLDKLATKPEQTATE